LGKILHEHVPIDAWLQSSTAKKQFVDFRLNEKRSLPKTIQEKCVDKFLGINKIHFFLMRKFADELIISSQNHSVYRVLESDTWLEYFDKSNSNISRLDHMIAYHWKILPNNNERDKHIDSFRLSSKFGVQEASNWKVLVFIIIAFLIGISGSVAGNFLTEFLKPKHPTELIDPSIKKTIKPQTKDMGTSINSVLLRK
jgi:hypothetical protein